MDADSTPRSANPPTPIDDFNLLPATNKSIFVGYQQKEYTMKTAKYWLALSALTLLIAGCNEESTAPTSETHGLWQTDLPSALATAKAENKHILMDFSGSDWCGWCIKLENEVFSKAAFIDYAQENLVLVLVDFPRKTQLPAEQAAANQALAQKYQVQGFPTVLILNPQGELVERTGYQQGGPDAYVDMIKKAIGQ
jgi:protein disulfide-isomerase